MSIAEKLTTIAENMQKVFDAGKAAGGGDNGEYDLFWDAFQNFGNRGFYSYGFSGEGWTDDSFKPKYDIKVSGNANYMFSGCRIKNIKNILAERGVTLDFSKCTSAGYLLPNSVPGQEFPPFDCSSMSNMTDVFRYAAYVTKIELTNVKTTLAWSNTFTNCSNLEHLSIQGSIGNTISLAQSSKLSDASIQSVMDALADLTGQTAQTVTFHATVGAKLTDEQKATITTKNWTLVY